MISRLRQNISFEGSEATRVVRPMWSTLLIFLIALGTEVQAQQITSQPERPQAEEAITIFFNAPECECPLSNHRADLFAHTGVIIEGNSSWQNVIGSWGNNAAQPQLTHLGNGMYSMEIDPDVYSFYSVSRSAKVNQLAFVFRSADGGTQTADLFLDIFEEGDANILSPIPNQLFSLGDSMLIHSVILGADSIEASVDNSWSDVQIGEEYFGYYQLPSRGNLNVRIRGWVNGSLVQQNLQIYVRQENNQVEVPSGYGPGYHDLGDGKILLILPAPKKEFVFVKGDFSDWKVAEEYQMNVSPDGNTFWIIIEGLDDKGQYGYQYILDGDVTQPDPYAHLILDEANDRWISSSTYPNLKAYPSGKTKGLVSVFETGQEEYEWQNDNYNRPEQDRLVIYELLIRDFVEDHSYRSVMDSLDYLQSLGINAIELMPVMEFEGNSSWGYNTSFHFGLDKYYGTQHDFKAFVDECHRRGIAVILDLVINHAYGQNPLVRMYWEDGAGGSRPSAESPYFNQESPNPVFSWGYDFDHESEWTVSYFNEVLSYWIDEYHVDGYRLDFTKGLTNNPGDGGRYDADRIGILKNYNAHLKENHPGHYLILEHFAPVSEERELTDDGMMVWANFNHAFNEFAMGYQPNSSFSWSFWDRRGFNGPYAVNYMESHDEERMLYKVQNFGKHTSGYDTRILETALERAKLASLFWIGVPGPKMMWMFGELGYDISIDDPCRVCEKPILWNYLQNSFRKDLKEHYSELIHLFLEDEIFHTDQVEMSTGGLVKGIELIKENRRVLIVGNMDVNPQTEIVPMLPEATWTDYFTGQTLRSSNGQLELELEPGEYLMLSNEGWDGTQASEDRIYFSGNVNSQIVKVSSSAALQSVEVYDIQGRMIREYDVQGLTEVDIEWPQQSSGVFVVRAKTINGTTRDYTGLGFVN